MKKTMGRLTKRARTGEKTKHRKFRYQNRDGSGRQEGRKKGKERREKQESERKEKEERLEVVNGLGQEKAVLIPRRSAESMDFTQVIRMELNYEGSGIATRAQR